MSDIQIEIVDVSTEKVGTYSKMSVTHRTNDYKGNPKVEAKALVSFACPTPVWEAMSKAQKGEQYIIHRVKDTNGKYWNWDGVEPADGSTPVATTSSAPAAARPSFADQDAKKQRYIIRQSCLKAAVDCVGSGGEAQEIMDTAEVFVKWVLEE